MQGLQIVLSNIVIANIGETNIFKVIKESILSLKDKHENEVHRIHCFLNENYYIPEEKIVKIKRMSNEYGVILDFFFICDYPADCEQYMELTSDYSICKIFNTNDTDDYLITKQIIDDLFDLYSIYIVINDDEDISINLIESENDILDYSDDSNEMIDDSNNKDDDDDDIEYDIMIDDGNQEGNMKIDENDKEEDAIIDENDNEDDDLGNKNKKTSKTKVKRTRLKASDAQAIYDTYITQGDAMAKTLCQSFKYKKTTYYKIIQNKGKVTEKYKKPDHPTKWDKPKIEKAIEYINDNPVLTLEEIIDKAVEESNFPRVAKSTLSSYLKTRLITMKSCRLDPVARNCDETKESRKTYCADFLRNLSRTFVFIDEMGFSCCTQRNRGRSLRGTICKRLGPLIKAPTVNVCMAVSKDIGIVHHSVKNCAFNGDLFSDFIDELIEKCLNLELKNICFIMDNVRMHKSQSEISEKCKKNGIEIVFLPVYSPELNPIENAFSIIKSHIKKLFRTKYYQQLLDTQKLSWGLKARAREKIVIDSLNESLARIDTTVMNELFAHMLSVFPRVFNNEDI